MAVSLWHKTSLAFILLTTSLPFTSGSNDTSGGLIFLSAPFTECHAPTIAETPSGLVVAFFAGTKEGYGDVGIWICRRVQGKWTAPAEVATGRQPGGIRFPCWNPVLYQAEDGLLWLFYKLGPSPREWWGMAMTSADHGQHWSEGQPLPDGFIGPVKNKPVTLPSGDLLCPSSTENDGWQAHFERFSSDGQHWEKAGLIDNSCFQLIQPTLLVHRRGRLQALCRSRENCVVESWSEDGGMTWSCPACTTLPNPNSGIDGLRLADGRCLLVYNEATVPPGAWGGPRTPLRLALSRNGHTWKPSILLEEGTGEYSYPAVIQAADDTIHVVYTWKRRSIRHVEIDPASLRPGRSGRQAMNAR